MQIAALGIGLRLPGFNGACDLFAVGAEVTRQRSEKGEAPRFVEMVVAIEDLAGHDGSRGLATARQQRLAKFEQFRRISLGAVRVAAAQ